QLPWACVASILVHELPDLALFPLLAHERHPAIGREAVREEADAPAQQRPEGPVDFRAGAEVDGVQKDVDGHKDRAMEIDRTHFSDTTARTLAPHPVVGNFHGVPTRLERAPRRRTPSR